MGGQVTQARSHCMESASGWSTQSKHHGGLPDLAAGESHSCHTPWALHQMGWGATVNCSHRPAMQSAKGYVAYSAHDGV